jgi:hypothetical protein
VIYFQLIRKDYCICCDTPFEEQSQFYLGAKQQLTFDEIKMYLSSLSVMKASKARILFWLYIAAEDSVIRVVLTQVTYGKEHTITYLSWRLIDAETRYSFLKGYVYSFLCLF